MIQHVVLSGSLKTCRERDCFTSNLLSLLIMVQTLKKIKKGKGRYRKDGTRKVDVDKGR